MNTVKRCLGVISILATVFAPTVPALAQHGTHSVAQTPTPAKVNEAGAGPDHEADVRRQVREQTRGTADVVAAMRAFSETGCDD